MRKQVVWTGLACIFSAMPGLIARGDDQVVPTVPAASPILEVVKEAPPVWLGEAWSAVPFDAGEDPNVLGPGGGMPTAGERAGDCGGTSCQTYGHRYFSTGVGARRLSGVPAADNFVPTADSSITSVCWSGIFAINATGNAACSPANPAASWTVRYFADNGGFPGAMLAEFRTSDGSLAVSASTGPNYSNNPVRTRHVLSGTHAPFAVEGGECYWLQVVSTLSGATNTCSFFWEFGTEGSGDDYCLFDSTVNGWERSDYRPNDYAWCLDIALDRPEGCTAVATPENDLCGNAIPLTIGAAPIAGTTYGSTADRNAPFCYDPSGLTGNSPGSGSGVWYSIVGTGGGVRINVCGPGSAQVPVGVYCGGCDALECVFGEDIGCSGLSFLTEVGRTYRILVNANALFADFTISASDTASFSTPNIVCDDCSISIPDNATPEAEMCGTDANGGCNSIPPVFAPNVDCSVVIAGEAWAEDNIRDTDWYSFTVTQTSVVTWTVEADFAPLVFLFSSTNCATYTTLASRQGGRCQPVSVSAVLNPGTYAAWAGPSGFTGYSCEGGRNRYVGRLIACEVADLTVTDVEAPEQIVTGQTAVVTWRINNTGTRSADGPWSDQVYASMNGVIGDSDDVALALAFNVVPNGTSIPAGGFLDRSLSFTMPSLPAGVQRLYVRTDEFDNVLEGNEDNNAALAGATSAVIGPDLVVQSAMFPPSVPQTRNMTVEWDDVNLGGFQASGLWTDQVWLSSDGVFGNFDDRFLGSLGVSATLAAGGGSIARSLSVNVPGSTPVGMYHLFIRTDSGNNVAETNESNNALDAGLIEVCALPVFTDDLTNRSVCPDAAVVYTVTPGEPDLMHQWQRNGVNLEGETGPTLTLAVPIAGTYRCQVTNACGTLVSRESVLTVLSPPGINTQPMSITVPRGTTASFTIAVPAGSMRQWQRFTGGMWQDVLGATGATFTVSTSAQPEDAGMYRCVVSNSCGLLNSDEVTLTVCEPPDFETQPSPQTICAGQSTSFTVQAFAPGGGEFTYQWRRNGSNLSNNTTFSGVTTPTLTITNASAGNAGNYDCVVSNGCGPSIASDAAALTVNTLATITQQPMSAIGCEGGSTLLSVAASSPTPATYQWQRLENTQQFSATNQFSPSANPNGPWSYTIGGVPIANQYPGDALIGPGWGQSHGTGVIARALNVPGHHDWQEGDLVIHTRNNSGSEYTAIRWTSPAAGTLNITGRAWDANSIPGRDIFWFLVVRGDLLAFRFSTIGLFRNDPGAQFANNLIGAGLSGIAVNPGDVVEFAALSSTLGQFLGVNLELSLTSSERQFVDIPGATSPTLTLNELSQADASQYRCVITNSCGSVNSNEASVQVATPPVFTMQPSPLIRPPGGSAMFSVAADGIGLQYQWQRNEADISNGGGYSGVTTPTLNITGINAGHAGDYRCIVTNPCGAFPSDEAALTICAGPTIDSPPSARTVCAGEPATFSVEASGEAGLTYQWQRNSINISGANAPTYTINSVVTGDAGNYRCVVSDSCTSTTSDAAALTVLTLPAISINQGNTPVCTGGMVTFTTSSSGGGLSFQWQKNEMDIEGATSPSLTINPVGLDSGGTYRCIATNLCGSTASAGVMLTVATQVIISQHPTPQDGHVGLAVQFSVEAQGFGLAYQWRKGGMNLANSGTVSGATTPTLTLSGLTAGAAGDYDCRVSNACWPMFSDPATLTIVGPDLIVPAGTVGTPPSVAFNESFQITWTERNIGTRDALLPWSNRVVFSLDSTLGNADDVTLGTFGANAALGGEGGETTYARNVSIPLAHTSVAGSYCLFIRTDVLGQVPELDESNNSTACVSINVTIPDLPDLVVESVGAPSEALAGQQFEVTWTVRNIGSGTASLPWSDRVLIADNAMGTGAASLGTRSAPVALGPGEAYQRSGIFTVPVTPGTYYAVVAADTSNQVIELSGEGNNQRVALLPVTVNPTPQADLVVESVSMPPDGVFSNTPTVISYTVRNIGDAATEVTSWKDFVFISTEADINFFGLNGNAGIFCSVTGAAPSNPQYLRPGEAYTHTAAFNLPNDTTGDYYVYALADRGGCGQSPRVPDSNRNNNFLRSGSTFHLALAPQPNLVALNVIAPQEAFSGQPITVTWVDRNIGAGLTDTGNWNDQVYLSRDNNPSITTGQDIHLVTLARSGSPLPPDTSTSLRSATGTIPVTQFGAFFVKVLVDSSNVVSELGFESDNVTLASLPLNVVLSARPDVQPASVSGPAGTTHHPGCFITVNWSAQNEGAEPDGSFNWNDAVFLSTDAVLSGNDKFLGRLGASCSPGDFPPYARTLTARIPSDTPPGMYRVIVQCDESNTLFEGACPVDCENNNVLASGTQFTVDVPDPVDLTPTAVGGPIGMTLVPTSPITVTWSAQNIGGGPVASISWRDAAYLSTDEALSGDDIRLGDVLNSSNPCMIAGYNRTLNSAAPQSTPPGSYFILVRVDDLGAIGEGECPEACESNNVIASAGTVLIEARSADLVPTIEMVSPDAGPINSTINVSWRVTNSGLAATQVGVWRDRVQLVNALNNPVGSAITFVRNGALGVGEFYIASVNLTTPVVGAGPYSVRVLTDADSEVYEAAGESNNAALAPFTISSDVPDLIVSAVQADGPGVAGQPVNVNWTVTNVGTLATLPGQSSWRDYVYLSPNEIIGDGDDFVVINRQRNGGVAGGDSYSVSQTFTTPIETSGAYRLYVRTDAIGQVFEGSESNNVLQDPQSLVILPALPANLVVQAITTPILATAGQPLTGLEVVIANVGSGATNASTWRDSFYLSRDQYLDASGDLFLGEISRSGVLSPGSDYIPAPPPIVPSGASGAYHVIVRTDSGGMVFEGAAEGDNVRASDAIVFVEQPDPSDLVVDSINPPASGMLGFPASFEWTILNDGEAPVNGQWQDTLYLSKDSTFDLGDTVIERFTVSTSGTPINPGESRTFARSANVPGVVPGTYHVFVRTDVYNNIPETNEDNNLTASLGTINVTAVPLTLGVVFNDAGAGLLQDRYYQFSAPSEETIRITLNAAEGHSTELYAKAGSIPNAGDFDEAYESPGLPMQIVTIPSSAPGSYFLLARKSFGMAPGMTIKAEIVPFGIESVSPTTVGAGVVTITLRGSRWRADTAFFLRSPHDGSLIPAIEIRELTGARARVTFDLTGLTPGDYDVVVNSSQLRETVDLPAGLRIDASAVPTVIAEYNAGPVIRRGRVEPRTIALRNTGNVDAAFVEVQVQTWNLPGVSMTVREVEEGELVETMGRRSMRFHVSDVAPGDVVILNLDVLLAPSYPSTNYAVTVHAIGFTLDQFIVASLIPRADQMREELIEEFLNDTTLTPEALAFAMDRLADVEAFRTIYIETLLSQGAFSRAQSVGGCLEDCNGQAFICFAACAAIVVKAPSAVGVAISGVCAIAWAKVDIKCRLCCHQPCNSSCSNSRGCECDASAPPGGACPAPPPCGGGSCGSSPRGEGLRVIDLSRGVRDDLDDGGGCSGSGGGSSQCNPSPAPFDPNEMRGPSGYGEEQWVPSAKPLSYRILFENLPTATAPAQIVKVTMPIDASLNPGSFRVGNFDIAGHEFIVPPNRVSYQKRLDLRETRGVFVDVSIGVDLFKTPAEAFWIFRSVDPDTNEQPLDALIGFLPPEDGEANGQGHLDFTIRPRITAPTGAALEAFADIVFDLNETITTNTVANTLDATPPSSQVDPVSPVINDPVVNLSVSTVDSEGPGIDRIRMFVSSDGGQYLNVGEFTEFDNIAFIGAPGVLFRVYSIALDLSGNEEPAPVVPDTAFVLPIINFAAGSDTGEADDKITNDPTPAFTIVAAPLSEIDIEIAGPTSIGGMTTADAMGRATFQVSSLEPLSDGEYILTATSEGVSFTFQFTVDTMPISPGEWLSVAVHGPAGPSALLVSANGTFVEPRSAGVSHLRVLLPAEERGRITLPPTGVTILGLNVQNMPINTAGIARQSFLTDTGSQPAIDVFFTPPLPDQAHYCIGLTGLTDTAGNTTAAESARISLLALVGDYTGDRRVNNTDVGAIRGRIGTDPIDPGNIEHVRADINTDGMIDQADENIVLAARGRDLRLVNPPCPTGRGPAGGSPSGPDDDDVIGVVSERSGAPGSSGGGGSPGTTADSAALALDSDGRARRTVADSTPTVGGALEQAEIALLMPGVERAEVEAFVTRSLFAPGEVERHPVDGWWIVTMDLPTDALRAESVARLLGDAGAYSTPVWRSAIGDAWIVRPLIRLVLPPGTTREAAESLVSAVGTRASLVWFGDRDGELIAEIESGAPTGDAVLGLTHAFAGQSLVLRAEAVALPQAEAVRADADGDGVITMQDLIHFLGAFGSEAAATEADLNRDGRADEGDLRSILRFFGREVPR